MVPCSEKHQNSCPYADRAGCYKCFLSCLLTYINDDNTAMLDEYILMSLGEQMFMKQAKSYNDR